MLEAQVWEFEYELDYKREERSYSIVGIGKGSIEKASLYSLAKT